ncbi:hypothetical protein [Stieleria varia]|uniref:3-keto-disaccharide hydrolase domain-containing protein n=1 Tax=Stieleria varia TaxID=2528005 RepID=A0A5C6B3M3_9BACT|nr:hypothetical protein [Stieleria varia]TWU06357.1 hypothetical protein Pla52n_20780 [Stieleria varia]
MTKLLLILTLCLMTIPTAPAEELRDDFSDPKMKGRAALRGDWKFENNSASCVADPELYKKYDNHGPILRWPVEMTDGTVEFEFQCSDVERLVLTFNKEGHVLRMGFNAPGKSSIFGWIGQSSKENKPKTIVKEGVPSMQDLNGRLWSVCKIAIKGDEADVMIGNYKTKIKHPSIAREKGEFTISFASGKFAVRDFRVTY